MTKTERILYLACALTFSLSAGDTYAQHKYGYTVVLLMLACILGSLSLVGCSEQAPAPISDADAAEVQDATTEADLEPEPECTQDSSCQAECYAVQEHSNLSPEEIVQLCNAQVCQAGQCQTEAGQ